jgi:antitoxin (DNA-binding transcriptional repressor) of toxin-antitoxin stability system
MDGVEAGESFVVTRDGREIGELVPIRRQRRFVARDDFMSISRGAPEVDVDAFMADVRGTLDDEVIDPYAR